jgi:hypothetical protein
MSNGAQPYAEFPPYATWAVHLGFDGWIYASCQQNFALSGELTGRQFQQIVTNGIAAKGGHISYSMDKKNVEPPPIVKSMIEFMSEALDSNLAYMPDIDPPRPPDEDQDLTVLMRKARDGDLLWVDDLLDRHVELEAVDDRGCTALMHAAIAGQFEVVERLLAAGADPNHHSKSGGTALMAAVQSQRNRSEIVRALLSHNANPNVKNSKGQTALDLCPRTDQRTAQIIRGFGGRKAAELRPLWESPWIKWPVVALFAGGLAVGLWLLLANFAADLLR